MLINGSYKEFFVKIFNIIIILFVDFQSDLYVSDCKMLEGHVVTLHDGSTAMIQASVVPKGTFPFVFALYTFQY